MSFSDLKLFALSSNQELAQRVAQEIGLPLGKSTVRQFSDGEIQVNIEESIRGKHVFILQSTSSPVNDNLMEILIMVDALKRASAQTINVVMPYYGYARQDRKARAREPITSKLVANMLQVAGVDRLLTIDLHASQIQGFFDVPVSHLTALYLLGDYFKKKPFDWENTVVVSPDMGRAKAAKKLSDYLDCGLAIAHKSRPRHNESAVMGIIGDITGKTCIVNDDMIDTAGTLCASVLKLKEMGAGDIYVCATHGIFSGPAIERLNEAPIEECVVTDAIPCAAANQPGSKIRTITVANELAEAIYAVYTDRPVSDIFGGDLNL